jgi:hypothetical protein
MDQAACDNTTFANCELTLRLKLRKFGMRLERSGFGYRLVHGNSVLLARGADGFGLSLDDIARFTSSALEYEGRGA